MGRDAGFSFVAFVLVSVGLLCHYGCALQVNFSANNVTDISAPPLNISCTPNNLVNPQESIVLLEVGKKGFPPLVILNQNNQLTKGKNFDQSRFKARGNLDKRWPYSSIVELTIESPMSEDSGEYECILYYQNTLQFLQEVRASGNLHVDILNEHEILRELLDRLDDIEKVVQTQQDTLDEQKDKIDQQEKVIIEQGRKILELENNTISECCESGFDELENKLDVLEANFTLHHNKSMGCDNYMVEIDRVLDNHDNRLAMNHDAILNLQNVSRDHSGDIRELFSATKDLQTNVRENTNSSLDQLSVLKNATNNIMTVIQNINQGREADQEKFRRALDMLQKNNSRKIEDLENDIRTNGGHDSALSNIIFEIRQALYNQSTEITTLQNKDCACPTSTEVTHRTPNPFPILTPSPTPGEHVKGMEAFFAGYDIDDYFVQQGRLVFSNLFFQEGDGYDAKNGLYTVPRAGFYIFHLAVMSGKEGHLVVDLMVGFTSMARLIDNDLDHLDQTSISTMLKLKKGDIVQVQVYSMTTGMTMDSHPYSFFSGYLYQAL